MKRSMLTAKVFSAFVMLGLAVTLGEAQSSIQVVNAASYAPSSSFAPGTIVTILGANLTNTVQNASTVSSPPTTLGGVTVTIGGIASGLFFVSPDQINARIDPGVPMGTATVVVTSSSGTFSTTITISINAAAGLFSLAGTGTAQGAILNAITYALGPFTVTSAMGPPGSAVGPTFLAIYLTGLNLSASPAVTIGGVSVPVFYFGNAPCCAGLEQINVQLVPKLAGAGTVPVLVTAAGVTSNVVTVTILPNSGQPTPTSTPLLSGVVAIPNSTIGLVSDRTDDLVQVVNTATKTLVATIRLPNGAKPGQIAVNSAGTLAVVVEPGQNTVAFIDLHMFQVLGQANVGREPVAVTIVGNRAFVVNQDSDSVTVVDLTSFTPLATISVGRAPSSIDVDAARNRLLVANSGAGTVSEIDLTSLQVIATLPLGVNSRPLSIRVVSSLNIAVITDASLKAGQALVVDLLNDTSQLINVADAELGSYTAAAVMGNQVFLTNSVDGLIAILTFSRNSNNQITFTGKVVPINSGVEQLDVDTAQGLLIITESNGDLLVFQLSTDTEVAEVPIGH